MLYGEHGAIPRPDIELRVEYQRTGETHRENRTMWGIRMKAIPRGRCRKRHLPPELIGPGHNEGVARPDRFTETDERTSVACVKRLFSSR